MSGNRISRVNSVKVIKVVEVKSLAVFQGDEAEIVEWFDTETGRRLGRNYSDAEMSAFGGDGGVSRQSIDRYHEPAQQMSTAEIEAAIKQGIQP